MKHFDQLLQEDIARYEGRHDDLIFQSSAFYRLLVGLLDDPRLPSRLRSLVIAAVAYFILPADVIPEEIEGPYGYVDDIFLCALVADQIRKTLESDAILIENWDGEAPLIPLLQDILVHEADLIGDSRPKILAYIGAPGWGE